MTIQSPLVYELCNLASSERHLHHCAEPHWHPDTPGIDDVKISSIAVHQKLKAVKVASSPGPDGVHPRTLSEAADTMFSPGQHLS